MNRLRDKVAVVTGGGGGIGGGIALTLAREGANLVIADMRADLAEKVVNEIKSVGVSALAVRTDVTKSGEVQKLVEETIKAFNGIDILVNVAGIHAIGLVKDLDESLWDNCLNVNLKGTFLCCKYVIPHMISRRNGKIVNIASIAGKTGIAGRAAYCSSKFALIGFTQALAKELAPHNINVNAICPGFVYTEMIRYLWEKGTSTDELDLYKIKANSPKDFYDQIAARIPLGRGQAPEDIGNAVVFLVSDESKNITAQSINVCGGLEVH